jgi:NADP-dependent 3-hydroxy acid dehydrogenase YdfG
MARRRAAEVAGELMSRSLFITGGATGIGAALSRRANAGGDRVFATGRTEATLRELSSELDPETSATLVCDSADWAQTQAAVAAAVERFGEIDVAVANAGGTAAGGIQDGDPEAWRTMVLTNVLGVAVTAKAVLPELKKSRGRLVLIGSVVGHKIPPGSLYSATKHAVTALAESIRLEVTKSGVGVTLIAPGRVATPFWSQLPDAPLLDPDAVAATILWACTQPPDVDVNEILVRPLGQEV